MEFEYLAPRYPCSCLDLNKKQPLESCNYNYNVTDSLGYNTWQMSILYIVYSGDTRTVNTLYLFVHFFSDHRMQAHPFDKSIYWFYTLKMLKTNIIRRAFIS